MGKESMNARDRAVMRVLLGVLAVNLVVAGGKAVVGYAIGSIALLADAVHSVLDASSNVVGLVGMTIASRPPDRGHPYGHRRFETLATLIIGILIALGFVGVLRGAVDAFAGDPSMPALSIAAVIVVAATLLVNLGISRYEAKRGRELGSALLAADSSHTLSDALATAVVLLSFAATQLGIVWADAIAALIVSAFIGRTAWKIVSSSLAVLVDSAPIEPETIRALALSVDGVCSVDRIRARGGEDFVYVDLVLHIEPGLEFAQAHAVADRVGLAIQSGLPHVKDVVVHFEPAEERP